MLGLELAFLIEIELQRDLVAIPGIGEDDQRAPVAIAVVAILWPLGTRAMAVMPSTVAPGRIGSIDTTTSALAARWLPWMVPVWPTPWALLSLLCASSQHSHHRIHLDTILR